MIHLGCRAFVQEEDTLWFSNFSFNGIFKANLQSGQIEQVHRFENFNSNKIEVHGQMYKEGDELIFIPFQDNQIISYHIKTHKECMVEIPMFGDRRNYRGIAYKKEGEIWLIPRNSIDKFFCYDLKNKSLKLHQELNDIIISIVEEGVELRATIYKNELILLIKEKHMICRINLDTLDVKYLEVDIKGINISQVQFDGTDYWILMKDSPNIYQWNPDRNICIEYISDDNETVNKTISNFFYKRIIFTKKENILLNYYAKNVKRINKEKRIIEDVFCYPKDFKLIEILKYGEVFSDAIIYGEELCLLPVRGSQILYYHLKNHTVRGNEFAISRKEISYLTDIVADDIKLNILSETDEVATLSNYIQLVKTKEEKNVHKPNIGELIYQMEIKR